MAEWRVLGSRRHLWLCVRKWVWKSKYSLRWVCKSMSVQRNLGRPCALIRGGRNLGWTLPKLIPRNLGVRLNKNQIQADCRLDTDSTAILLNPTRWNPKPWQLCIFITDMDSHHSSNWNLHLSSHPSNPTVLHETDDLHLLIKNTHYTNTVGGVYTESHIHSYAP